MSYSSNCPVSRPVVVDYEVEKYLGGLAWNDKHGLFFPVEADILPIKHPQILSYRPSER